MAVGMKVPRRTAKEPDELAVLAQRLGENATARRLELRMSQEKVARLMDMSRETVRHAESGTHLPEWETLRELARALMTTIAWLLGYGGESRVNFSGRILAA